MPAHALSEPALGLVIAVLGTADTWPLLLLVTAPAVGSHDPRRRRRARQVLRLLRPSHRPRGADEEPHPQNSGLALPEDLRCPFPACLVRPPYVMEDRGDIDEAFLVLGRALSCWRRPQPLREGFLKTECGPWETLLGRITPPATRRMGLAQAAEAHGELEEKGSGKIVLVP